MILKLGLTVAEFFLAEEFLDVPGRDRHALLAAGDDDLRRFTTDGRQLTLKAPDTRFSRVVTHDINERLIFQLQLGFCQSTSWLCRGPFFSHGPVLP